jgi:uncharacterized protein YbaR (Trm112 family)
MAGQSRLSAQKHEFDARILEQLACPVCFGVLHLAKLGDGIVCEGCGRGYPVVDGIAVLIAERAIEAQKFV